MCVPYARINLDKWRILSVLNRRNWDDVELIYAISGNGALLLRKKKLYFFGKWITYTTLPTLPIKLENLGLENIGFIASGIEHAVLLSNEGFVSTFGINNKYGQLGVEDGDCLTANGELLVHNPTIPAIIVDICCGNYYTLALDNDGKVWFWGSVYVGDVVYNNPKCLSITKIVKISAGAKRAAALDQSGKVYWWSAYSYHQSKITVPDSVVIHQIACGDENNLYVLTNENTLFRYDGRLNPIEPDCRFNYLTSNSDNKIAARSNDGRFFHWDEPYTSWGIYRTKATNILECFANSKMPGVYLPSKEESAFVYEEDNTLTENIGRLYDSQNFSDIDIILTDDKIHAHKCILAARSELFSKLLTSVESKVLNFYNTNSKIMKSYVTYIYTGSLPEIDNFGHLLELYDMSKDDPNKLADYCVKQGRILTNEQNALANYVASANFNNTVLMKYCAKFVVNNLEESAITEQFKSLSSKEVHQLIEYGVKNDQ